MDKRTTQLLTLKNTLLLLFTTLSFMTFCHAAGTEPTVTVDVIHSTNKYAQDETYPVLFRLNIKEGWFIHGTTLDEEFLIPTVLSIQDSEYLEIKNILFPLPVNIKFEYSSKPVEVFSGTVMVSGAVEVKGESSIGPHSITGILNYQACSYTSCLPPKEIPLKLDFNIVPHGSKTVTLNNEFFQPSGVRANDLLMGKISSGLFLSLFWILLQGLALNLTPCIYPLIPITVSYFGGRSDKTKGHIVLSGLIYISGLAVTNSLLGVTAAMSGGMLGAILQYPAVLVFIALVMLSLGLSFFGLWEFNLPPALTRLASKNFKGYFGTFFMGLTLGIVAAPCIGPFVLGLLIYVGQKGDPLIGFIYFFVLSIGIGLPLCVLAVFSGAINRLPMSGDWMLWVKKIMGWILIFMGYYFISSMINNPMIEGMIILLLVIAAGIHLGWLDKTGKAGHRFNIFKKGLSVIIILAGALYSYNGLDINEGVDWTAYDEVILEKSARESKPAIMDVYADWCIPCRSMDESLFKDPEVLNVSKNFTMVRLDITKKFPGQDEIIRKYSIEGAPTIIFFNRHGDEIPELRIESIIDRGDFILKMQKTLGF